MPLVESSYHQRPRYLFNGHLQTIIPSLFRKVELVYERERILTPDGDFLDLDWSRVGSEQLTILSHGLEGSADRPYIRGMVKALNQSGSDALAWNFRSCSGQPNQLLRSYHMGATDDLEQVIKHAVCEKGYQSINLVGFSMGGGLTLLYLGQRPKEVAPQVQRAVVFSVPCHLQTATQTMASRSNMIYMRRFLRSLRGKLHHKALLLPGQLELTDYQKMRTFHEFDNRYTAPLHGFASADDYYERCSYRQYLPAIQVPTLIVNALNDPFLSPECYPVEEAKQNPNVFLEIPPHGGHVGFAISLREDRYYSEARAVRFLKE
ncbi:alpha/beta fold hydrolase [soil metagenome]